MGEGLQACINAGAKQAPILQHGAWIMPERHCRNASRSRKSQRCVEAPISDFESFDDRPGWRTPSASCPRLGGATPRTAVATRSGQDRRGSAHAGTAPNSATGGCRSQTRLEVDEKQAGQVSRESSAASMMRLGKPGAPCDSRSRNSLRLRSSVWLGQGASIRNRSIATWRFSISDLMLPPFSGPRINAADKRVPVVPTTLNDIRKTDQDVDELLL